VQLVLQQCPSRLFAGKLSYPYCIGSRLSLLNHSGIRSRTRTLAQRRSVPFAKSQTISSSSRHLHHILIHSPLSACRGSQPILAVSHGPSNTLESHFFPGAASIGGQRIHWTTNRRSELGRLGWAASLDRPTMYLAFRGRFESSDISIVDGPRRISDSIA
jgi:hypothetical protein